MLSPSETFRPDVVARAFESYELRRASAFVLTLAFETWARISARSCGGSN
jgi:hypothetical protein